MLKYATGAGLSAEYAKTAADTAYATRQETLRQNMLTMIVERGWGGTKTYEYAIMVGLEEKIAKELSDYAKKLQATDLSSDYLNQVKNKN